MTAIPTAALTTALTTELAVALDAAPRWTVRGGVVPRYHPIGVGRTPGTAVCGRYRP